MGMLDSVFAKCPDCGAEVEFQSKAGICELKKYHSDSVPANVADALNGRIERCLACAAQVNVTLAAPIPRVALVVSSDTAVSKWD